ncbi:MAG: hypothetical protein QM706_15985 [Nitrospira sp.]
MDNPLDDPDARPVTHTYKGRSISLALGLNNDGSWGCSYRILDFNLSDMKMKAQFLLDGFTNPHEAKAAALRAAQLEIDSLG